MENNQLLVLASINADFNLSVDKFPSIGETVSGHDFTLTVGGKGANQAFYADQCQINTTMLCSIGDDYFGEFILKELEKSSLTVKHQIANSTTGKAFVYIHDGDNRIILDPGANAKFDQTKIDEEINKTDAKYFLSQLEIPYHIVKKSFKTAKNNQLTTFLNPSPATISDFEIYRYVDYLVLNETEAIVLSKMNLDLENHENLNKIASYFLNLGVRNVLITLGKHGSYFLNDHEELFVNALKIKAVNSTGAGDSYLGAFISQIIKQTSIKQAMEFATKIAALVCQNYATQVHLTNLLTTEELWPQN